VDWQLLPALAAAGLMTAIGVAAAIRPASLELVGVFARSPLGTSEIRAVFGGMFAALGLAALVTREPVVFAALGAAWLADVTVRMVSVAVDRVPPKEALPVLAIGLLMGLALLSGYWLA
jgi:hypothetical protein